MYNNKDIQKIINFLQDFGCATIQQLQIIFNDKNNNFKNILTSNTISKKGDIFVHNTKVVDKKMIAALDVLCKYKKRYIQFHKGFDPIYITFLTKDNILYHIIVTDKNNEKGILKLLKLAPYSLPEADKYILLFEDASCYGDIVCPIPYLYCTYPNIEIIKKADVL